MLQENSLMAPAKRETTMERLQRDPLAEAMRLLLEVARLAVANRLLPEHLDLSQMEQHSVQAVRRRLPAVRARLQHLRFRRAERFPFRRRARADIRKILAHTHFSEKYWPLKNIIARCTAAVAPFALDIVAA